MRDGAHPSPFAALFFPVSKKVPIYCWIDTESFPVVEWRNPVSNSRPSGDFLHHNQAALTTRLQHLSSFPIAQSKSVTDRQTDRLTETGIGSKVNQFIYTLVWNYMRNIRILAKAVLKIFCSQGCSYTKCLCPKRGNNSTENLWNRFKN